MPSRRLNLHTLKPEPDDICASVTEGISEAKEPVLEICSQDIGSMGRETEVSQSTTDLEALRSKFIEALCTDLDDKDYVDVDSIVRPSTDPGPEPCLFLSLSPLV